LREATNITAVYIRSRHPSYLEVYEHILFSFPISSVLILSHVYSYVSQVFSFRSPHHSFVCISLPYTVPVPRTSTFHIPSKQVHLLVHLISLPPALNQTTKTHSTIYKYFSKNRRLSLIKH